MNRKPSNAYSLLSSLSLLALIVGGCRDRIEPETPDYVEYGWELMAEATEASYRAAIVQFEDGKDLDPEYADAWNGLGWAFARLGSADTSAERFTTAAAKTDTTIVGTEILAGRSFARLALGQFSGAVSDAKGALNLTPSWEFRRDETVFYEHLYLTAAIGFYGLGEFDSSLVWVRKLDETFTADVTTPSGQSKLAAELESLEEELPEG